MPILHLLEASFLERTEVGEQLLKALASGDTLLLLDADPAAPARAQLEVWAGETWRGLRVCVLRAESFCVRSELGDVSTPPAIEQIDDHAWVRLIADHECIQQWH